MSVARFYAGPDPLEPGVRLLPAAEATHATAARRLRPGQEIVVFDGHGRVAAAEIRSSGRSGLELEVGSVRQMPLPAGPEITLAVAVPKGPRQDVLFEKSTELGVAALWPMVTTRSVVRPAPGRRAKWVRTSIEASKQCGRAWLPEILEPAPFSEILERARGHDQRFIALPDGAAADGATGRVVVLIGPEGGFDEHELAAAQSAGFARLRLGQWVLRVETAAIAAVARLSS